MRRAASAQPPRGGRAGAGSLLHAGHAPARCACQLRHTLLLCQPGPARGQGLVSRVASAGCGLHVMWQGSAAPGSSQANFLALNGTQKHDWRPAQKWHWHCAHLEVFNVKCGSSSQQTGCHHADPLCRTRGRHTDDMIQPPRGTQLCQDGRWLRTGGADGNCRAGSSSRVMAADCAWNVCEASRS